MDRGSEYMEKFEFINSTISGKFNGKLCLLDVQNVQVHGRIWIRQMQEIVKIQ